MHILNVNMTLDPVHGGGTAERTFQMSRFLIKNGATCTVLSTDLDWSPALFKAFEGIQVILVPCVWKRFYLPKLSFTRIRDVVVGADVIHLMGHWTVLNVLVYLFARHFRKPYVICPAGSLRVYGRSKLLKRAYNALIGQRIVRDAVRCIAVTEQERGEFARYGVPGDRIVVIPNGIDSRGSLTGDGTTFRREYGLSDHPFILFVGRLNSIKGPDLLLRAFGEIAQEFSNHHLVFVGPDEGMLPILKELAVSLAIQHRVHFIGYVGGASKGSAYAATDCVVIPSRQEAMSLVVLEAGVAGAPVVLTDQCGFNVVEDERAGLVVSASIEGVARGMRALLKDPQESKSMGVNLKRFVEKHFDWNVIVDRYLNLYQSIASRTSGSVRFSS